jgi:hypothetical protein
MEMKGEQKIQKGTAENVTINNPYWSFRACLAVWLRVLFK